ncbi:MAG TPA: RNA polymerase sigma factor [Thermoanaerobaculia bacterium]|nr:RNA polymerase sigma factor [Thermoanaerobaculia bacterium]
MLEAVLEGIPRVMNEPHAEDRRLAAGCARADPQIFEEVYRRFGDRMKSIAYNHLGTVADAEDAVQETFLKIHRAAATFTGEAAFTTWMYRILVNTCYDLLRKRKRRGEETSIEDDVRVISVDDLKRIALRRMLDGLPEQRRTVFMLFEIEGLSHAEIGGILNISEGNSKWILFATKKELRKQWKESR